MRFGIILFCSKPVLSQDMLFKSRVPCFSKCCFLFFRYGVTHSFWAYDTSHKASEGLRCLAAVPLLDAGGNVLAVVTQRRDGKK